MRKILFRGKRIDNGEWVYGYPFISDTDNSTFIVRGSWSVKIEFEVDNATVGQYIELTDKNGEKIFDGDIVSFDFDIGSWGRIAKILFEDGEYRYRVITNADDLYNCRICGENKNCKVIGNIHDNPELIN